jgi:hypothetical protein
MATIKRNPKFPGRYWIIENGKKVLYGKSFSKEEALKKAAARSTRTKLAKKKMVKKKSTTKKSSGGIASYVRKVQNSPGVKSADKKVKDLVKKLAAAKKLKAAKVKEARKKLKK